MKTKMLICWIALTVCISLSARTDLYKPVGGVIQFKNMHLWRGQEVTDEATFATDIYFTNKKQNLKIGLWGGAGINGNFKEIDYYASYSIQGFTFALWDIYNFSPGADYNNRQVFNYNARETGHFIDHSVAYQFQEKFPLKLYWATVIFGRDRGAMNDKNRYSTFVEASYSILKDNIMNLNAGIGGAFALNKGKNITGEKSDTHFYGKSPGIVSLTLTASKILDLWGYKLPLSVTGLWNPENNYANIQITLNFISF